MIYCIASWSVSRVSLLVGSSRKIIQDIRYRPRPERAGLVPWRLFVNWLSLWGSRHFCGLFYGSFSGLSVLWVTLDVNWKRPAVAASHSGQDAFIVKTWLDLPQSQQSFISSSGKSTLILIAAGKHWIGCISSKIHLPCKSMDQLEWRCLY